MLVALNGVAFAEENYAAMKKIKSGMVPDAEVTYTVARHGKKKNVDVTLAQMPDEVIAEWVGGHMLDHVMVAQSDY